MTPVECIARLCALVPPPRYPLTRFHGVLAPRAKLRPRIVPKRPGKATAPCVATPATPDTPIKPRARDRAEERPRPRDRGGDVIPVALPVTATALARVLPGADVPAPNILSVSHLLRIAGGLLYAATSKVPWATLLARTFELDVKSCPRCGGRLVVRAVVTDHDIARRILDAIPNAARAPPETDSSVLHEPGFA